MESRRHLRRGALLALSLALLGQPILSHLHGLTDSAGAASWRRAATTPAYHTSRPAPASDADHDTVCPLCLARVQAQAQAPAPSSNQCTLVVATAPDLPPSQAPPSDPARRTPSLRGPPRNA